MKNRRKFDEIFISISYTTSTDLRFSEKRITLHNIQVEKFFRSPSALTNFQSFLKWIDFNYFYDFFISYYKRSITNHMDQTFSRITRIAAYINGFYLFRFDAITSDIQRPGKIIHHSIMSNERFKICNIDFIPNPLVYIYFISYRNIHPQETFSETIIIT